MITTVTLNPSIDATWVLNEFDEGAINRVVEKREEAGGKGINISRFLTKFGVETLATGLVGGSTGIKLRNLLEEEDVHHVFVNLAENETRTNVTLYVESGNKTIKINQPGPKVSDEDLETMKQLLLSSAKHSKHIVLSGKNPPCTNNTIVIDMLMACKRLGAGVALDSESFTKEEIIQLKPHMYKPNAEEFSRLMGRDLMTVPELIQSAKVLCSQGVGYIVISMGGDGLLGISKAETFMVNAPKITLRSTVGAGDSVVSGFMMAMVEGADFPDALKKAAACGSAMAATDGTQIPEPESVIELEKQVQVQAI